MKTKEELNALKEEVNALNKKLAELSEEELRQVTGGKVVSAVVAGGGDPSPFGSPSDPSKSTGTIYELHVYGEETKEAAEAKFFGNK